MLTPAPHSDWLAFLQAIMLLPIAMAGAYPCCCDRTVSSTVTSTSTSTSSGPPEPPPPGSTSTSTSIPPLPPRRSSSVGAIQYSDCECCRNGGTVPDQWQIEVSGLTEPFGCAPGAEVGNGVYIADGLTYAADPYHTACITVDLSGCSAQGGGIPSLFCPDERASNGWYFTPAGLRGLAANATVDVVAAFVLSWKGAAAATCGGQYAIFEHLWKDDAPKPVSSFSCLDITNPSTDLPDCSDMDEIELSIVSSFPGGRPGSAFAFTITGF